MKIGDIVSENKSCKEYVVVDIVHNDAEFNNGKQYNYKVVPYCKDVDNLVVNVSKSKLICTNLNISINKVNYTQYGYSNIRGDETIYLERVFKTQQQR